MPLRMFLFEKKFVLVSSSTLQAVNYGPGNENIILLRILGNLMLLFAEVFIVK